VATRLPAGAAGPQPSGAEHRIVIEIEGLCKLKTKVLQARYRELFGEETRSVFPRS
jgi:hypothetical protein